jgi:hypothetical protein
MENTGTLNSEKSLKNLPIFTNFGPKPKLFKILVLHPRYLALNDQKNHLSLLSLSPKFLIFYFPQADKMFFSFLYLQNYVHFNGDHTPPTWA